MPCKKCGTNFTKIHENNCFDNGNAYMVRVYKCENDHFYGACNEMMKPTNKTDRVMLPKKRIEEKLTPEEIAIRKKMKPLDIKKDFIIKEKK